MGCSMLRMQFLSCCSSQKEARSWSPEGDARATKQLERVSRRLGSRAQGQARRLNGAATIQPSAPFCTQAEFESKRFEL